MASQASNQEAPARGEAQDFLRDELANGPRPVKEIKAEAREAGITLTALRKAKDRICRACKGGMQDGWYWELIPEEDPR